MLEWDPWDMASNFCFHVWAEKSVFIGENYAILLHVMITDDDIEMDDDSDEEPDPNNDGFIDI